MAITQTHSRMVSDVDAGSTYATTTALAAKADTSSLGTAATLNVGTGANNIVQLNGSSQLPAVDGSQLTNVGGGKIVSRYYAEYTTYSSTAADLPADDTIPQNTEGVEILTLTTGTLSAATNRLRITYGGTFTSDTTGAKCTAALFDGTSNAIHAITGTRASASNSHPYPLNGVYEYAPGATTAKTISVRYGANGSDTMYVNGIHTGRLFGGVLAWTLVVEEIEA